MTTSIGHHIFRVKAYVAAGVLMHDFTDADLLAAFKGVPRKRLEGVRTNMLAMRLEGTYDRGKYERWERLVCRVLELRASRWPARRRNQ